MMFLPPTPLAVIPASGTLAIPATLSSYAPAVGLTIFTQAAYTGSSNGIDNYVRLPITP